MITNEKIKNCYAPGEKVQFGEVRYIFKESDKTSKKKCDLQTNSSQCCNRYFCMMCGGCGNSFPKGTTKGYFQRMKQNRSANPSSSIRHSAKASSSVTTWILIASIAMDAMPLPPYSISSALWTS